VLRNRTTATRTDLSGDAVEEISSNLRRLLADVFALYVKPKNFHWHMSGQHFRDYHLLLVEQCAQFFAMTDEIAERARKIGGTTIRSITAIAKNQRLKDNNKEMVSPQEMLGELYADNQQLTRSLRATHKVSLTDQILTLCMSGHFGLREAIAVATRQRHAHRNRSRTVNRRRPN
jgi:starvation-inducible DNA-binding protein